MSARMPRTLMLVTVLAVLVPSVARAHDESAVPGAASIQAEFHTSLTDAEKKLIELAETTPPGKYGWSPGKGVRSASEVFMHVSTANYMIPMLLGFAPPAGIEPMKLESSVKEKDQAVKTLRESFVAAHAAIDKTTDLDSKIDMFGNQVTRRYALMMLVTHAHEHLGQSIAYARSNGITPPWTAREEAAAAARKAAPAKK